MVLGQQVRVVQHARLAIGSHANRGDEIEPQQREVGEVVSGERLGLQVRVHEAQTAQTNLTRASSADVGQLGACARCRQ